MGRTLSYLLWATFLFSPVLARAEKYAFLMGGSGEDRAPTNFFTQDFNRMKTSLEKRGWKVIVVFDGKRGGVKDAPSATNENIDSKLNQLLEKVKAGDQTMVIAHTHGSQKQNEAGVGHPLLTETPGGYPSSKLQEFSKKLVDKKVQTSLLDLSCFSGNTQQANAPYCTVTLASKEYVSVCSADGKQGGFTDAFIKELENTSKKNSIESAFLNARVKDDTPVNFPQISSIDTPAEAVWDHFFQVVDPSHMRRDQINQPVVACEAAQLDPIVSSLKKTISTMKAPPQTLSAKVKKIDTQLDVVQKSTTAANQKVEALKNELGRAIDWSKYPELKPIAATLGLAPVIAVSGMLQVLNMPGDYHTFAWLSPDKKIILDQLKPYHIPLKAAFLKETNNEQVLAEYKKASEILVNDSRALLKSERAFYNDYSKQVARKNSLCKDFSL